MCIRDRFITFTTDIVGILFFLNLFKHFNVSMVSPDCDTTIAREFLSSLLLRYLYSEAISIDTLMSIVTGIELEHDPIYVSRRNNHLADGGIDHLIGFNANCTKGN